MPQHNTPQLRFPEFSGAFKYEPIGNYIDLLSGFAFKGEDITEDKSGISLMRGINITEGYIRHNKEIDRYYIGDTKKFEKYFLKEGDLVLGMDGSKVGKNVAIVNGNDVNSLLIQRVARLRSIKADINYIYQHVTSKKFHSYVDVVNTSSGIPHISSQQIKDFKIGFPTLPEQQKIASFLSAADKKIEQLQQKKALLEQYKKGMMQKLFSQQVRFKDDNGVEFEDWEEKELGEMCTFLRGSALSKSDLNRDGEFLCIHYGELFTIYKETIVNIVSKTNILNGVRSINGDILMPSSDVTPQGLAKASAILIDNVVLGGDINIIRPISYNSVLLSYILNFNQKKIIQLVTGTTVKHIYNKDVKQLKFILPADNKEQTKIANFLTAIDAKINAVSAQLNSAKVFKKGLLQQMFV